jgi:hypothetical protein
VQRDHGGRKPGVAVPCRQVAAGNRLNWRDSISWPADRC